MAKLARVAVVVALLMAAWGFRAAAQEGTIESGLQPAAAGKPPTKVPHSFDVHTFNGRNANRFHCLVCANDIHPTVLLFLKEPVEGKTMAVETLLTKLDELIEKYRAMDKYPEVTTVAAYAVFLSPAAQTALDKSKETDPAALVKEATDRRALYKRMTDWAGKTKDVVVACAIPEAAKGYKVNPDAGFTGLYYESLNVLDNYSFKELEAGDVDAIIGRVEAKLQARIAALEAAKKTPKK